MTKKISSACFFAFFALFILSGKASAETIASRANEDNKSFKGVWIHKIKTPGQEAYQVFTRINIDVKGKKFRIEHEDKDMAMIYDGGTLWELVPSQKTASFIEMAELKQIPFWKMNTQAGPLMPLNFAGENFVAGRICNVYRITSEYKEGSVSVTYWIDKEKELLLKKEYLLIIRGKPYVREGYECESVKFDPALPPATFEANVPEDWTKIKKLNLDLGPLFKTRF